MNANVGANANMNANSGDNKRCPVCGRAWVTRESHFASHPLCRKAYDGVSGKKVEWVKAEAEFVAERVVRVCKVCGGKHHARGYCHKHYMRIYMQAYRKKAP